jgi:hypothetical protein
MTVLFGPPSAYQKELPSLSQCGMTAPPRKRLLNRSCRKNRSSCCSAVNGSVREVVIIVPIPCPDSRPDHQFHRGIAPSCCGFFGLVARNTSPGRVAMNGSMANRAAGSLPESVGADTWSHQWSASYHSDGCTAVALPSIRFYCRIDLRVSQFPFSGVCNCLMATHG